MNEVDGSLSAEFTDPRLVAVYESVNQYAAGAQPEFHSQLASELGASAIIDFGCGTGLITRELARQGYLLIGVDPAAAMIEVARSRPDGDRVQWICGDASRIGTPAADLAIMSGHVAQFFLTDESWHATLMALWGALRPGGRLAFETRNPEAREWERWGRDARTTVHDPDSGRIDFWSEVNGVADGLVAYTNHYVFAATGEELLAPYALRFRTAEEIRRSLTGAGFTTERVYGDWDRRACDPGAPELIAVASR